MIQSRKLLFQSIKQQIFITFLFNDFYLQIYFIQLKNEVNMDSDQSGSKNTIEIKLKTYAPNSPRFKSDQISHGNELQFTSRKKHKGIQLMTKNIKDSLKNKEITIPFVQFQKDIEDELNNIIQLRFDIVKSKISSKSINQILAYFSKEWKKIKPVTHPSNSQNPQKVKYLLNQYQISDKYTRNQTTNNDKMQIKQSIINLPMYNQQNSREGMILSQKIAQLKLQNQKLSEDLRKTRKIRIDLQNDFRKLKADAVTHVKNLQIKQTSLQEQILILTNKKQKLHDQIQNKQRKLNAPQILEQIRSDYKIIIQKLKEQLQREKEAKKIIQISYNSLKTQKEKFSQNINPLKENEVVISNQELLKLTILKNAYEKIQVQNELLANSKQQFRQKLQEYQTRQNNSQKQIQKIENDKQILVESLNNTIQKLVQQINTLKQKNEQQFNSQQQTIMELQSKNINFKCKMQNIINQMNTKSESYEQQILQTNHSIDQLNLTIQKYQQLLMEKDNKSKQLQLQLEKQKLKIKDQMPINTNSIQQKQAQTYNEVMNLSNRLKYTEQQAELDKKNIQDKEQQLQKLLADFELLNRQNGQLITSKEKINLQLQTVKEKIHSIQEQNLKLKTQKQKQTQYINSEKRQLQQQKQKNQRKNHQFQQKYAQLIQQIQGLKAARFNYLEKEKHIELTNLNQQLKQESEKIKSKEINFNMERQRYNEQIKFLEDQMVLKQNKLTQQKQNYNMLKRQYNQINLKYTECDRKISSLVQNLLQKDNQIGILQEKFSIISEKQRNLISQLLQNEKQKQKKDNSYNYQKLVLQGKLNNKILEIAQLTNQIQNLNETLKDSTILNSELSEEIQKNRLIINHSMTNQEQIHHFTTVIEEKNIQIQKLQLQIQEKQIKIDQINLKLNNTNQIDTYAKQIQKTLYQKTNQISKMQELIKKINYQHQQNLQQKDQQIGKKQITIQQLKAKLSYFEGISKQTDKIVHSLFQNQVLAGHIEHKKYLKQIIEQRTKLHLIRTKLIYSYDPLNLTNFHKYIDEKSGIVVVIKMVNGNFLATYCQGQFNKKKASNQDGMIISLTNREHFVLVEKGRRSITYDDYYLIFGNSEVRLRSNQKILFSNFGISNGYYANRGKNVSILLGGSPQQRELQMEHFQVYQLIMTE